MGKIILGLVLLCAIGSAFEDKISKYKNQAFAQGVCQIQKCTKKSCNYIDKWCKNPYTYNDYRF